MPDLTRSKRHTFPGYACFVVMILILTLDAAALSRAEEDTIDKIFSRWDTGDGPGMVVGVARKGKPIFVKGYGMANLEYGIRNDPDSVFHVASVSKQFTVFFILLLEEEGKLSLDDDIQKHLPQVPDFGAQITVRHLIHHTSGLRDQWDLLSLSGFRPDDIKTNQDVLDLVARQRELNFPPGDRHLYSNTGFTLLAVIVERLSGESFREFTTERIFEPLGMKHTHFQDDYNRLVKNRSYGMSPIRGGGYRRNIPAFDTVGATSLFTTAGDLLKWSDNFESKKVGSDALFEKILERGKLNNGETLSYAGGLVHGEFYGVPIVSHSGGDAAYRSQFDRYPDHGLTVVVLANLPVDPGGLAKRVARVLLGDRVKKPARGSSRNTASAGGAEPEEEFEPTDGYFADFVGAYYSPELDTTFTVILAGEGLTVTRKKFGNLDMRVRGRDEFSVEGIRTTFERDGEGHVTGFKLNTGRIINLRFEKVNAE